MDTEDLGFIKDAASNTSNAIRRLLAVMPIRLSALSKILLDFQRTLVDRLLLREYRPQEYTDHLFKSLVRDEDIYRLITTCASVITECHHYIDDRNDEMTKLSGDEKGVLLALISAHVLMCNFVFALSVYAEDTAKENESLEMFIQTDEILMISQAESILETLPELVQPGEDYFAVSRRQWLKRALLECKLICRLAMDAQKQDQPSGESGANAYTKDPKSGKAITLKRPLEILSQSVQDLHSEHENDDTIPEKSNSQPRPLRWCPACSHVFTSSFHRHFKSHLRTLFPRCIPDESDMIGCGYCHNERLDDITQSAFQGHREFIQHILSTHTTNIMPPVWVFSSSLRNLLLEPSGPFRRMFQDLCHHHETTEVDLEWTPNATTHDLLADLQHCGGSIYDTSFDFVTPIYADQLQYMAHRLVQRAFNISFPRTTEVKTSTASDLNLLGAPVDDGPAHDPRESSLFSANPDSTIDRGSFEEIMKMTSDPDPMSPDTETPDPPSEAPQPHLLTHSGAVDSENWQILRTQLPEEWQWDMEYRATSAGTNGTERGCWTCIPTDPNEATDLPLTIGQAPLVIPADYSFPIIGGVNPPPDPRLSLIDCTAQVDLELIRDILLTFDRSIGFYLLVNGLLQIIVPDDFDTEWAMSHLPQKFGGLEVCYIPQTIEPTMLRAQGDLSSSTAQALGTTSILGHTTIPRPSLPHSLHLNDMIEARPKPVTGKDKYAGKVGLKILKRGEAEPVLIMSTHVITDAIHGKSRGSGGTTEAQEFIKEDWNDHVEIWARGEKVGTVEKTFDINPGVFPEGFTNDVTIIKPDKIEAIKDVQSGVADLGWLSMPSWFGLRMDTSSLMVLGEPTRKAKSLMSSRPVEAMVIGQGILLNRGNRKPSNFDPTEIWGESISRAVLYRTFPNLAPANGYSGIAIYADGIREDGTKGPGIVGFQSFVQRGRGPQIYEMEDGPTKRPLSQKLGLGMVQFYGAFPVPDEIRKDYLIL